MKLAGCIVLFVCSSLAGFMFASKENKKLVILKELSALSGKLTCGIAKRTPVDEIFRRYTNENLPIYVKGGCRREIVASLQKLSEENICRNETENCIELLSEISSSCDASELEGNLIRFSRLVSENLDFAQKECAKKKEMYIKLGIFAGLLVCITVI